MKNKTWIIIIGIVVLLAVYVIGVQRSLVNLSEEINASWGDVEIQYQRRADLIPNIVETVKAQAIKEQEIFTQIAEARARLSGAANIQDKIDANAEVTSVLGRLLAIAESYPELKQNQGFQDLRIQLEGTENRIAVARKYYNDSVKSYNKKIKVFPTNIAAGILGYKDEFPYIQAEEGAEKAPEVKF
ncbi:MAG TPA: LemA family protein [Bacillota bacterium]|nr:LemA family protein [Bacillota bacterium]HOR86868.1 LemA family protein [Bacillota bacterium]HPL53455.1 LemA family protein [Bacillota bacterium]